MTMLARAQAKYIKITPIKARLVIDLIRGKKVDDAIQVLQYTKKRGAKILENIIKSAVANAKQKDEEIDSDNLFISCAKADGGPTTERFLPRAMGRATVVIKRTSHITIELDAKKVKVAPVDEKKAPITKKRKKEK